MHYFGIDSEHVSQMEIGAKKQSGNVIETNFKS